MKYRIVILITVFILTACSQRQQMKAKIVERKEMPGNRLKIEYRYTINNKSYVNSTIINNVIINSDSINITVDPSHPDIATPELIMLEKQ